MHKITIAVSLDNTLNNLTQLIDLQDPATVTSLPFDDLIERENISKLKHINGNSMYDLLNTPEFYDEIGLKDDWTHEGLEFLCANFDVIILSSCNAKTVKYKKAWLEKFFPFFNTRNFIPCSTKTVVKADWLIDDSSRISSFQNSTILVDTPYNRHIDDERDNCRRMTDWRDIHNFFIRVKSEGIKSLSL